MGPGTRVPSPRHRATASGEESTACVRVRAPLSGQQGHWSINFGGDWLLAEGLGTCARVCVSLTLQPCIDEAVSVSILV